MTANGATLMGRSDIGLIAKGKTANLVVLDGDLLNDPKTIQKVTTVFKNGIGYDPEKLIRSLRGNVGSVNDDLMTYFGQKEPTETPELFAPELVSRSDRHEFGCTFSKDADAFYFGVDNNGIMEIHYSKLAKGVWSPQKKLFESDSVSYNDPMFSPDEKRLYFISDRALNKEAVKDDIDIWYVERKNKESAWSAPINLVAPVNSERNEYYASFTSEGTLYFASKSNSENAPRYAFDIYSATYKNGRFLNPTMLPETINMNRYEADVFIAPDDSYMIFCSIRKNGLGQGDLYISFKDGKGQWTAAVNMGSDINTEKHELCPFVSTDGKYLFYTSNQDIYWVSTNILERYRPKKEGQ